MDPQGTARSDGADPENPTVAAAPPPSRRPLSWPARVATGLALLLAAVVIAGFVIRVPYTTIAPGEALSLPSRITVEGARSYPEPRGDIRLLFVREANHVNLWRYLQSRYLSSDIDLVKDSAVNPGKLTVAQLEEQALQQMAGAKSAATAVALRAAGFGVGVQPGLVVSDLFVDLPAIKVLHWGDVILTADGHKISSAPDLTSVIAKHPAGEEVILAISRAGKRVTERVRVATAQGRSVIGVVASPRLSFPVKVGIDTTGIGGPSAGLAMSLAILDDLTPGDLTGGAHVAVTGTIDAAGRVGEIGGIEQKAVSARAAHVTLFIVPQCSPNDSAEALASCRADLARTAERAGKKIKVVPVSTFEQALHALRENGGAPVSTTTGSSTSTIPAA